MNELSSFPLGVLDYCAFIAYFIVLSLIGYVAGVWAIYGGLASVAWTDFFTVIVMVLGGSLVSVLGLKMLAGQSGSILEGIIHGVLNDCA